MKKFKFNKKIISISMGLSAIIATPILVTSCSSNVSSTLLDKLVSKGNGTTFSTNNSLSNVIQQALISENGQNEFMTEIVGQTILNWYINLGSDNSKSSRKQAYKKAYDNKIDEINESYDSAVTSSQKTNKSDFLLKFQQDELDTHGGTEQSWKKEQIIEWAISKFKEEIFSNLYVSLVNNQGEFVNTTSTNLLNALNENNNVKFSFSKAATNTTNQDNFVIDQYAQFQQFVFDQWVQVEAPFILSYASWNYGTPKSGLSSIYQKDAIGQTTSSSTIAGSYNFPYFDNTNTNDSLSVTEMFTNFVNNAATNNGYITETTNGLMRIGSGYSSSTSNYMLMKNHSSFSGGDVQLAMGATYLFANSINGSSNNPVSKASSYKQTTLNKTITTSSSSNFDIITSNFVSTSPFANSITNGGTSIANSNSTNVPSTQIASELVSQILLNPETSSNQQTQIAGETTTTVKDLYTIDAFVPTNNNLTNFLFLRNSEGVYAIALDGGTYISKANTLEEAKKRAGNIVLYRYLENNMNSELGLTIDLKSELNNFLSSNFNTLVYKYWQLNQTQANTLFNFEWLSENEKSVLSAIADYVYIKNNFQAFENYQIAAYNNKASLASNYGTNFAKKNGLASQLPYEFTNATSGSIITSKATTGSIGHYKILETVKFANPFGSTYSNGNSLDWTNPYATNGAYSKVVSSVESYVSNLKISPLTSDFAGFKYSQYIYSNNYFINQALLSYGSDGDVLGNFVKQNIILNNINKNGNNVLTKINNNQLTAANFKVSNLTANSQDISKYYNSALANYFFNSTFDSSSNKWINLEKDFNASFAKPSTSTGSMQTSTSSYPTITYDELDTYKLNTWLSNKISVNSTNSSEYLNFLTLVATSQYLLENNGEKLMAELRSSLETDGSTFIVWESSIDKSFDTTSTVKSSKDLLYGNDGNSIITNVNNSQATAYYPNSSTNVSNGTYVSTNTANSTFNSATNYYVHSSNMNGFQGIQTGTENANISSTLKNILFVDPTTYNNDKKGLLYGYASSREELIKEINEYTYDSQVENLVNKMKVLFPEIKELNEVNQLQTLQEKKAKMEAILNQKTTSSTPGTETNQNTYLIPDSVFQPRNGYISNGQTGSNSTLYKDPNNLISNYEYGAYVIQINESNLTDLSTFVKYLTQTFTSHSPSNANGSTSLPTDTTSGTSEQQAYSLLANLLVSKSQISSVQNEAINLIAQANQVVVYDIRLNNQLGEKWASNWKDQSE